MYFKPFKVEAWLNEHEPKAKYHLGETSIAPLSLRELKEITDFRWEELLDIKLDYGEIQGISILREEVSKLFLNTNPEEVLITNGSIEANFLAIAALSEECETFLAEFPEYNQLYELPKAFGKKVKLYRLKRENGFSVDVEELLETARDSQAVILNHPHNPTGAALEEEKMQYIIENLIKAGKKIMFDQVYLNLSKENPITPSARKLSNEVIVTGGLSKSFGLPGLRIGWIIAPKSFIERCWKIRDYVAISISPLNQFLAYKALQNKDKILKRSRDILRKNFDIISNWMEKNRDIIDWIPPKEGCVCFPWLKKVENSEDLCKALMERDSVLLVPGSCFDMPEHIRIGFGFESEILIKGLEVLEKFLRRDIDNL
ncbi:MAG: aminotransferase class I/II-fold pyridoxal phosphate-dependent enzyme [Synergistetes bacterium]|nr:aminotransferase class I/II-fold pyridoxal phosphate-dependent enzyme [Synergistota bacterium]MCX8127199.1 aminotransferase class I/II-fold pyridoxal phosphate-dependent enzyme [Synergistota bacterium]MDW8191915.1 aminotransferase class I/II-fold pyridoxal phosphate-dependent enzyme [Synergistota bacterium]